MKYTLRQLQIFLAIAKYQNISQAAEILHMSQSAASAALQNLEQNYGLTLFTRSGKRLSLNEVGKTLRHKAEALVAHAGEFEQELNGHQDIGHLSIAASFTIGNHLAVNFLADYLARHPNAQVDLNVVNTPEVVSEVLNYEVDIGMIEAEVQHKDLELIPWMHDELVVFCSSTHPLAKKGRLSESDIVQVPWVLREPDSGARHTFDQAMAGLMPQLNVYLEFKHNEAIKRAVEAELGVGCLSEIVLQRDFEAGDLVPLLLPENRHMKRTFYFVLPRKRHKKTAVDWWIELCSQSLLPAVDSDS